MPDGATDGLPERLGDFLHTVVRSRPALRVWVLSWDYSMLYALEREWLPVYQLGWRTHPRLRFRLDGCHPLGASHHRKVVVVDDAIAFVGGFDLAGSRWDRTSHRPDEPLRIDAAGRSYPPFHDVRAMLDGPAAAALGDLARERWRRATGRMLRADPVPGSAWSAWPPDVAPDFSGVSVGIARTEPAFGKRPAVHEVLALHRDAIGAARRDLYFANQYLTADTIAHALAERLRAPGHLQVAIVSRRSESGWLEERTMGVLRARFHERLGGADARPHYGLRAIEALRREGRSLAPLDPKRDAERAARLPPQVLVDPEQPIAPERLMHLLVPADEGPPVSRRLVALGLLATALLLLAVAWRATPLSEYLDLVTLAAIAQRMADGPYTAVAVIGGYVVAGLLVVPVTLLIGATGFVFGPLEGGLYATAGSLASALVTYLLGRWLGRDAVRRIAGRRINRLSRRIARRGVLAVTVLRLMPVAPFSLVNLVAGASHIRLRDFLLGSAIGMAPGILLTVVFVHHLRETLRDPSVATVGVLALIVAALVALSVACRRLLLGREPVERSDGGAARAV